MVVASRQRPVALTPLGRELIQAMGLPPAKWLLSFLGRIQPVWTSHHWKLKLLALVTVACKLLHSRRVTLAAHRANSAPKASSESKTAAIAEAPLTAPPAPVPPPTLTELFGGTDGSDLGYAELVSSACLCAVGCLVMVRKAHALGMLIALQTEDSLGSWLRYAIMYPALSVLNTVFIDAANHMGQRLARKWRRNLTRKLHDMYFANMAYYRIQNGTGVPDPDTRICREAKTLADACAGLAVSLTNAPVYCLIFSAATTSVRNWKWSITPVLFYYLSIAWIMRSQPASRAYVEGCLAGALSKLTQALTRIQLHAERICMLQGDGFESSKLQSQVKEVRDWGIAAPKVLLLPNWAEQVCFGHPQLNLYLFLGYAQASCMAANDIRSRFPAEALPLDPAQPTNWSALQWGRVLSDLHSWLNSCIGWGAIVQAWIAKRSLESVSYRIQELFVQLKRISADADRDSAKSTFYDKFKDLGPVISFQGVTIETPTKHVLLKDLTFRVEEGQMLLICGHNGAGKSSIIRCLCSLWPVYEGTIARPGGFKQAEEYAKLNEEIYYLPQKPCSVLGSLSDQLTYPLRVPGGLPEKDLRRWLRYVDLEYLADRRIGADAVSRVESSLQALKSSSDIGAAEDGNSSIDWEVLLSLGEQQALSIARLLYHHPRFAILDECTSAVGKVLERRLFELAQELGISCITITHRPALKEHHDRMLQLTGHMSEDGHGWALSDLWSDQQGQTRTRRPHCANEGEVHARIEAFLSQNHESTTAASDAPTEHDLTDLRSAKYRRKVNQGNSPTVYADDLVRSRWPTRLGRIRAIVQLGLHTASERWAAMKRIALIVAMLRIDASMTWWFYRGTMGMVQAGMSGNRALMISEFLVTGAIPFINGIVGQIIKYQMTLMSRDVWASAVDRLQSRVMQGATCLKLTNPTDPRVPRIENPTLRLQEMWKLGQDIRDQVSIICFDVARVALWLPIMLRGVPVTGPLVLVGNFVFFRACLLLAPDYALIERTAAMLESRFQVLHTRLRSIAEPVAFSGGGSTEREIIEPAFEDVMKHEESAANQRFIHQVLTNFHTDYRQLPIWTSRLMSRRFAQTTNPLHPDGFSTSMVLSNFLWDRSIEKTQIAVQHFVMLAEALARIDGQCQRCLELVVACDCIDALESQTNLGNDVQSASANAIGGGPTDKGCVSVKGLDLVTSSGTCLARKVEFRVNAGTPLIITGPNASGKSLLGSVLLGLWGARGEDVSLAVTGALGPRPPLKMLMPAPQRIYLAAGPLWMQLPYPITPPQLTPPFELEVRNIPDGKTAEDLIGVYGPCGAIGTRFMPGANADSCVAVIAFESSQGLLKALARPQDHILDGHELSCEPTPRLDGPGGLPDFKLMRRCLRATGIEHILLREEAGWLAERTWEDILSGGEQQRLCLARVLYHKPTFGLLDECTSMVAADAEADLYRTLFEDWGVTPVALTQRMYMPDLFKKQVSLGVRNPDGWEVYA